MTTVTDDSHKAIKADVEANDVVLFMKAPRRCRSAASPAGWRGC
jgi:hypothetical protein